jgi:outer membrane protein assembly factor BamD (BamD/ComL family)
VRKKIESAQEADKLLRVSRVYIDNKLYGPARERLTKIVTDYPDTPSVKEAKELLKQIEKSG